jgi:hypothetical protein
MKYVMIRRGGQVLPIIFPEFLVHEDVANAIIGVLENMDGPNLQPREVVSAGDVTVPLASCDGSSQTLGIGSRYNQDERLITFGQYSGYME